VVAYPNRGERWESAVGWVAGSGFTDEEFASSAALWLQHGARVIACP
jgi:S-methylmethionine-dependent homocysteine/selenocysteine methylase